VPSNVEVKFRLRDPAGFRRLAEGLADRHEVLRQEDTFFAVAHGRLKLRCFPDGTGQLIHYERPDEAGPKPCRYRIFRTQGPSELKATLGEALGVAGVVRKTRDVYLVGQTRVHADEVEGLGAFGELEVVLRDGQNAEDGAAVARELMGALGIDEADLIDRAYVDMIEEAGGEWEGAS
jgi:adenylate cyclase class IV